MLFSNSLNILILYVAVGFLMLTFMPNIKVLDDKQNERLNITVFRFFILMGVLKFMNYDTTTASVISLSVSLGMFWLSGQNIIEKYTVSLNPTKYEPNGVYGISAQLNPDEIISEMDKTLPLHVKGWNTSEDKLYAVLDSNGNPLMENNLQVIAPKVPIELGSEYLRDSNGELLYTAPVASVDTNGDILRDLDGKPIIQPVKCVMDSDGKPILDNDNNYVINPCVM